MSITERRRLCPPPERGEAGREPRAPLPGPQHPPQHVGRELKGLGVSLCVSVCVYVCRGAGLGVTFAAACVRACVCLCVRVRVRVPALAALSQEVLRKAVAPSLSARFPERGD